jgi:hypothetical protein
LARGAERRRLPAASGGFILRLDHPKLGVAAACIRELS